MLNARSAGRERVADKSTLSRLEHATAGGLAAAQRRAWLWADGRFAAADASIKM
jgi:hypothetical protein